MKLEMLNSFINFLEKSVNKTPNLVVALPDLPDLNYISHSEELLFCLIQRATGISFSGFLVVDKNDQRSDPMSFGNLREVYSAAYVV